MYRKLIKDLENWKNSKNRKPLILKGARQVGKTWLIKLFGKEYYEKCAYINFDNNKRMEQLFNGDYDVERIIQGLKIESGIDIESKNTLIIFDEIQEVPKALSSLKYFCENAREFHIIAAGSLLGVSLHEGTSFPVGKVDFLSLYPLDFQEFLLALGEKQLSDLIDRNEFEMIKVFKNKLINLLKEYFYVGGMPEVVSNYIENKDYNQVRTIQNNLLLSYENDFTKHIPSYLVPRVRDLWYNIPTQLAKENKKFLYGLVKKGARAREYESALLWLIDAGLIYRVNRINDYKTPLSSYQDYKAFKLYCLDVGLLCAKANIDVKTLLKENDIFVEFKGSLTENYVLTEIKSNVTEFVFYWSNDSGTSEIDFIIENNSKILPIEVKATENLQAKSLKAFIQKYNSDANIRTSLKDYKKEQNINNIPLYMIKNIKSIDL